jgi:NAD(P)-dependent dehydrogenase (short-subunit alcohol dehydrogenase family)
MHRPTARPYRVRPLAQQTVVITGASSGIGRCAATLLAARGASVVLSARRRDALDDLVRQIKAAGGEALAAPADVRSEPDLEAVLLAAVDRYGRVDTWVNNASIYAQGNVEDITVEEFRELLDVDLLGYIRGTRCALAQMRRQGHGGIIQVSSILARRGAAYFSAYAAAKAGLDGFTQSLRAELWGTGIQVSTVYLPPLDTPIYRHARGKFGTIPKPPPPVSDPVAAARAIARLAERPEPELVVGGFGHLYLALPRLPARLGDWILHRTAALTRTDLPSVADNWARPMGDRPRVHGGWRSEAPLRQVLRETGRLVPWRPVLGAAALGLVAAAGIVGFAPDARRLRRRRRGRWLRRAL